MEYCKIQSDDNISVQDEIIRRQHGPFVTSYAEVLSNVALLLVNEFHSI